MTTTMAVWIVVGFAFAAANLPWLSERFFFAFRPRGGQKKAWQRWLEWLGMYVVAAGVAVGVERKLTGELYSQGWEFVVITFCLFLVFALPGFLYRHDFMHYVERR